jgi:hypothetical protein
MNGWVKLHRCTLDKAVWQNHNLWRVFCWCLMKATHKEIEQIVGMTKVILQPGQFVYGRHVASAECGLSPSTVRNCMDWLKNNRTLDIKSDNKKSIVTIVNWALYQSQDEEKDSKQDNNRTTTGQQQDTNKNINNIKKDKNNISPGFEKFYEEFPRHEGRADAERAWKKIKESEVGAVMDGVARYKIKMAGTEKRFIKTPAAWLNGRRWEDEHGGSVKAGNDKKPVGPEGFWI